jgi:Ankyrin repeats (3 copies)
MARRIASPLLRERLAKARAAWKATRRAAAIELAAGVFISEGREVFAKTDRALFDAMLEKLKPPVGYETWDAYFAAEPEGNHESDDAIVDRLQRERGKTKLHEAAERGRLASVEKLLADGADANAVHRNGELRWTPLCAAVFGDHRAVVERLLVAGARVDGKGVTAAIFGVQSVAVAKLLVDAGARLDVMDGLGRSVLARHVDVQSSRGVIAYLKKAGAR